MAIDPSRPADLECPQCGVVGSKVINTRAADFNQIYRRRQCTNGHRFTTYENVDDG